MNKIRKQELTDTEISYIIEMAWMDKIPFEAIKYQFGLLEKVKITVIKNLERSMVQKDIGGSVFFKSFYCKVFC